jgi:hypothetical protein
MIPRDNALHIHHALASAHAIGRVARGFAHFTRAMKPTLLDSRIDNVWLSKVPPTMAWSAVLGAQREAIVNPGKFGSSIQHKAIMPDNIALHYDPPTPIRSQTASQPFKAWLTFISRVSAPVAASSSRKRHPHHPKSSRPDDTGSDPFADLEQNAKRLAGELVAPFTLLLNRALLDTREALTDLRIFLSKTSILSKITKWILVGVGTLFAIGKIATYLQTKFFEPIITNAKVLSSPFFALRWLLLRGAPATFLRLSRLTSEVAQYVATFAELSFGWYVIGAFGLAIAGYELYRHWDAVKRLLSRSIESAHRAVANLMKWLADKTRNAPAYLHDSMLSIAATHSKAPHLLNAAAPAMRGLNGARAVERAAAGMRPARLRAIRQAAAAAAFAAPLMLASAPAAAFVPPLISANDTARLAAPLSAVRMTQNAIVINYAPNVTIHSDGAADTAALKRRVIEILERHGRELHQVLQREMVRQQRRDFQPRYSNGQE